MDWQEEVFNALDAIADSTACFFYPAEWPDGTVITYSGLNVTPGIVADDEEYTTDITVKVDIYDFDPEKVKETVKQVKQKMKDIDFVRTYCLDLFDISSRMHHTTMRYRRNQ